MMARLLSTMWLDVKIQYRHKLYHVSVGLALLLGLGIRRLADPQLAATLVPVTILLGVGGTAFVYIAGLIIFERDQHSLDAILVSPLRLTEYLVSKVTTLTLLVLVEGGVLVLVSQGFTAVAWLPLLTGTALLGAMFALFGAILIVRFSTITDFLMPALLVALPLQAPALYFAGIVDSPILLISPTSAATMLIWGGWNGLQAWQLLYGLAYSALVLGVGHRWALDAFVKHVVTGERS